MFTDRFEMIEIINLPRRKDRRREIAVELTRLGLPESRYSFFPAFSPADKNLFPSPGAHGAFLSHRAVLKKAADSGASLLILEDDCAFTPEASTHDLHGDFDIFYGGYYAEPGKELDQSEIIGAHLMGFSAEAARAASDYLSDYTSADFKVDPEAVAANRVQPHLRPGVDGAYVWFRRAHPQLKTVFAVPPLANQRPSRSDIARLPFYDRVPGLRQLADTARGLKRHLR